jgi:hypothetical protein
LDVHGIALVADVHDISPCCQLPKTKWKDQEPINVSEPLANAQLIGIHRANYRLRTSQTNLQARSGHNLMKELSELLHALLPTMCVIAYKQKPHYGLRMASGLAPG